MVGPGRRPPRAVRDTRRPPPVPWPSRSPGAAGPCSARRLPAGRRERPCSRAAPARCATRHGRSPSRRRRAGRPSDSFDRTFSISRCRVDSGASAAARDTRCTTASGSRASHPSAASSSSATGSSTGSPACATTSRTSREGSSRSLSSSGRIVRAGSAPSASSATARSGPGRPGLSASAVSRSRTRVPWGSDSRPRAARIAATRTTASSEVSAARTGSTARGSVMDSSAIRSEALAEARRWPRGARESAGRRGCR